jgi:hypothetical protein
MQRISAQQEFWLKIVLECFPHRHSSNTGHRNNRRSMIKSMFAHNRNYKAWKKLNKNAEGH